MEQIITAIQEFDLKTLGQGLLMLIGGAAILAKLTPTQKDDNILAKIMQVVNMLGMNTGSTKNVEDAVKDGEVVKEENVKTLVAKKDRV